MKLLRITGMAGLAIILAACSSPKIKISKIEGADTEGHTKFRLPGTLVMFDWEMGKDGKPTGKLSAKTAALAAEDADILGIAGTGWYQNWGINTNIKMTSQDDPTIIHELGVEAEDKRIEIIQGVAAVAVAAIGIVPLVNTDAAKGERAAKAGEANDLPVGLDVSALLTEIATAGSTCSPAPASTPNQKSVENGLTCPNWRLKARDNSTEVWKVEIKLAARSKTAQPYAEFVSGLPRSSSNMVYSSCRELKLLISPVRSGAGLAPAVPSGQIFVIQIADPAFVETVRLPDKGSVAMKDSCGVDVKSTGNPYSSSLDLAKEALTQAKAIRDALNKTSGATPKAPTQ